LTGNQWLQFDIGPPTLVTGVVTRGRGDGRRKHWVTRFRLAYSNSTDGPWLYYKDAPHLHYKVPFDASPLLNMLLTNTVEATGTRRLLNSHDASEFILHYEQFQDKISAF